MSSDTGMCGECRREGLGTFLWGLGDEEIHRPRHVAADGALVGFCSDRAQQHLLAHVVHLGLPALENRPMMASHRPCKVSGYRPLHLDSSELAERVVGTRGR